ncbi:MAG: VWA domain-containing protein [Alphaproteobacteria bacterium]|nr:VWA domain-containing protein [Alphaproteobacteria bacterium]
MMFPFPQASRLVVAALAAQLTYITVASGAEDATPAPCTEDAMLVFDASGSMAGNGWGYGSENPTAISRLDRVQRALSKILPTITRYRRVGLITYGTGAYNQCNVQLQFPPVENAADRVLATVRALVPTGRTPLSTAVEQAAEVLDFRQKPGIVVLLTDGEETCGGFPCDLGQRLHDEADQLTVHVIGLRVEGYTWMGEQSLLDVKCLAEKNGGLYLAVETEEELINALERTLGCPMVTLR